MAKAPTVSGKKIDATTAPAILAKEQPPAKPLPLRPASASRFGSSPARAQRKAAINVPSAEEVVAPPDAPPAEIPAGTRYKVRVNSLFVAHNEVFRPDMDYEVSEEIYNGSVDGKPFKDFCVTADQRVRQ
jgi:hypothetical protein